MILTCYTDIYTGCPKKTNNCGPPKAHFKTPLTTVLIQVNDDVKHTFAWTIERFSERQETNSQFLWSSKFTIRADDQVRRSALLLQEIY